MALLEQEKYDDVLAASDAFLARGKPSVDLLEIREATEKEDRDDGFDPVQFVESSRHDPKQMFAQLKDLATTHIADEPLRKLVLTLLDAHAEGLMRLPATRDKYYPFAGGLLEHTLSVRLGRRLLVPVARVPRRPGRPHEQRPGCP